jgi:hypothetical protein
MKEFNFEPLKGYEGLYEICKEGIIKSLPRQGSAPLESYLAIRIDRNGYQRVILSKNNKRKHRRVHRLLAIQYLPNPENKRCVNHIDGNKKNNDLSNLEWTTYSENQKHAIENGLIIIGTGEDARNVKLTEKDVLYIRAMKGKISQRKLGKKFNVDHGCIGRVQRRQTWKHIS